MAAPYSRNESILRAIIDGKEYTDMPHSRMEALLIELKDSIEAGGGGSGDGAKPLTTEQMNTLKKILKD